MFTRYTIASLLLLVGCADKHVTANELTGKTFSALYGAPSGLKADEQDIANALMAVKRSYSFKAAGKGTIQVASAMQMPLTWSIRQDSLYIVVDMLGSQEQMAYRAARDGQNIELVAKDHHVTLSPL